MAERTRIDKTHKVLQFYNGSMIICSTFVWYTSSISIWNIVVMPCRQHAVSCTHCCIVETSTRYLFLLSCCSVSCISPVRRSDVLLHVHLLSAAILCVFWYSDSGIKKGTYQLWLLVSVLTQQLNRNQYPSYIGTSICLLFSCCGRGYRIRAYLEGKQAANWRTIGIDRSAGNFSLATAIISFVQMFRYCYYFCDSTNSMATAAWVKVGIWGWPSAQERLTRYTQNRMSSCSLKSSNLLQVSHWQVIKWAFAHNPTVFYCQQVLM